MRQTIARIRRFATSEQGPTAVEYAVLLALVLLACLTAVRAFGTNTQKSLTNTAQSIAS